MASFAYIFEKSLECKVVKTGLDYIYIACSLDYAQAILKSTSSEAYANLKLAEQLRKRNSGLKKKREEKAQTNQSPSHTSSLGSSSNFKCKCTRNRANRVEGVLPRTLWCCALRSTR